ncbi:MAG: hypothetical protein HRS57_01745, partial [Mycoplasmataceae bacterium]|nr:hypothetical protein [Mycoplasmataceae bacterium]
HSLFISAILFTSLLAVSGLDTGNKYVSDTYSNEVSSTTSYTVDETVNHSDGDITNFFVTPGDSLDSVKVSYDLANPSKYNPNNVKIQIEKYNDSGNLLPINVSSDPYMVQQVPRTATSDKKPYEGITSKPFNPYDFENSITEYTLTPVYDWFNYDLGNIINNLGAVTNQGIDSVWSTNASDEYWQVHYYPSFWDDISDDKLNTSVDANIFVDDDPTTPSIDESIFSVHENYNINALSNSNYFYINFLEEDSDYKITMTINDSLTVSDTVHTNKRISQAEIQSSNGDDFVLNMNPMIESWSTTWLTFENSYYNINTSNAKSPVKMQWNPVDGPYIKKEGNSTPNKKKISWLEKSILGIDIDVNDISNIRDDSFLNKSVTNGYTQREFMIDYFNTYRAYSYESFYYSQSSPQNADEYSASKLFDFSSGHYEGWTTDDNMTIDTNNPSGTYVWESDGTNPYDYDSLSVNKLFGLSNNYRDTKTTEIHFNKSDNTDITDNSKTIFSYYMSYFLYDNLDEQASVTQESLNNSSPSNIRNEHIYSDSTDLSFYPIEDPDLIVSQSSKYSGSSIYLDLNIPSIDPTVDYKVEYKVYPESDKLNKDMYEYNILKDDSGSDFSSSSSGVGVIDGLEPATDYVVETRIKLGDFSVTSTSNEITASTADIPTIQVTEDNWVESGSLNLLKDSNIEITIDLQVNGSWYFEEMEIIICDKTGKTELSNWVNLSGKLDTSGSYTFYINTSTFSTFNFDYGEQYTYKLRAKPIDSSGTGHKLEETVGGWIIYDDISSTLKPGSNADGIIMSSENYMDLDKLEYEFSDSNELIISIDSSTIKEYDDSEINLSFSIDYVKWSDSHKNSSTSSYKYNFNITIGIDSLDLPSSEVNILDASNNVIGKAEISYDDLSNDLYIKFEFYESSNLTNIKLNIIELTSISYSRYVSTDPNHIETITTSGASFNPSNSLVDQTINNQNEPVYLKNTTANPSDLNNIEKVNTNSNLGLESEIDNNSSLNYNIKWTVHTESGLASPPPINPSDTIHPSSITSSKVNFSIDKSVAAFSIGTNYRIEIYLEYDEIGSITYNGVIQTTPSNGISTKDNLNNFNEIIVNTNNKYNDIDYTPTIYQTYIDGVKLQYSIDLSRASLDNEDNIFLKEIQITGNSGLTLWTYNINSDNTLVSDILISSISPNTEYTFTVNFVWGITTGGKSSNEVGSFTTGDVFTFTTNKLPDLKIVDLDLYLDGFSGNYKIENANSNQIVSSTISSSNIYFTESTKNYPSQVFNNVAFSTNASTGPDTYSYDLNIRVEIVGVNGNTFIDYKLNDVSVTIALPTVIIEDDDWDSNYVDSFSFNFTMNQFSAVVDSESSALTSANTVNLNLDNTTINTANLLASNYLLTLSEVSGINGIATPTGNKWITSYSYNGVLYDIHDPSVSNPSIDLNNVNGSTIKIYVDRDYMQSYIDERTNGVTDSDFKFKIGVLSDYNSVSGTALKSIPSQLSIYSSHAIPVPKFNVGDKTGILVDSATLGTLEGRTSEYATLNKVSFVPQSTTSISYLPNFDIQYTFYTKPMDQVSKSENVFNDPLKIGLGVNSNSVTNNQLKNGNTLSLSFDWSINGSRDAYNEASTITGAGAYVYLRFEYQGDPDNSSGGPYYIKYDNGNSDMTDYYGFSKIMDIGFDYPFFTSISLVSDLTTTDSLTFTYQLNVPDKYNIYLHKLTFEIYSPTEYFVYSTDSITSDERIVTFSGLTPNTEYEINIELEYFEILNGRKQNYGSKTLETEDPIDWMVGDDAGRNFEIDGKTINASSTEADWDHDWLTYNKYIDNITFESEGSNVKISLDFSEMDPSIISAQYFEITTYTKTSSNKVGIYETPYSNKYIPVEESSIAINDLENGDYWFKVEIYDSKPSTYSTTANLISVQEFGSFNDPFLSFNYHYTMPAWEKSVISISVILFFAIIMMSYIWKVRYYSPDALEQVSDRLSSSLLTDVFDEDAYDNNDYVKSTTTINKSLFFGLMKYDISIRTKNLIERENENALNVLGLQSNHRYDLYENLSNLEAKALNNMYLESRISYGDSVNIDEVKRTISSIYKRRNRDNKNQKIDDSRISQYLI